MCMKALVVLGLLLGSGLALAGAVVTAANAPVGELGEDQVRRLFLGREHRVQGLSVTVVYQKGGPQRDGFERDVLGKAGPELNSYWSKLIFTGRARAPEELASDAEVKLRVSTTPGAFGYIDDGAVDDSVRVVYRY